MRGKIWMAAGLLAAFFLVEAGLARAERTPTARTSGYRSNGVRPNIAVPYLTTGGTAFMSGYVQPRIYSSPILDDPRNPGAKPVFNLIFWGSVMSFGDRSNGATPRPK